jgi:exodeoxyribonuclease X
MDALKTSRSPENLQEPDRILYELLGIWKCAERPLVEIDPPWSRSVYRCLRVALCHHFLPGLDSYSQSAVLYHLIRPQARELLKGAHSADADVYNCHIILSHLIALMVKPGENITWEQIWQRSETAHIPTVMTFGKHKGVPIKDIPGDYKQWLLRQSDVDPYLAKALRGEAA